MEVAGKAYGLCGGEEDLVVGGGTAEVVALSELAAEPHRGVQFAGGLQSFGEAAGGLRPALGSAAGFVLSSSSPPCSTPGPPGEVLALKAS